MILPQPPPPFAHWMLAEIYEQPQTLARTLGRYVDGDEFRAETTDILRNWLARQHQLLIAASGSSRHAGLLAEVLLEADTDLPVDVEYASEYPYRTVRAASEAGLIVISQSGETADTLAALRRAAAQHQPTLAITNVPGSSMDREAQVAMPTLAGRELAIPATKSFTAQLAVLELLTLLAAEARGMLQPTGRAQSLRELQALPELVQSQLSGWHSSVEAMAEAVRQASSFLFLGRDLHYPIAREGALKLKESAYVHAEGYPGGELKHGPNALVSEGTPLVMIATVDHGDPHSVVRYDKMLQLMRDMKAQGAVILAVCNQGDREVLPLATAAVEVRAATEPLLAICEVIPLQMLAYFLATARGIDVDRPRNLVKAVVTE